MKALVTASQVREWARSQPEGAFPIEAYVSIAPGARGRLDPAIREAFNAAHKGTPYNEAVHARKSTVVPLKRTQGGKVRTVKEPIQTSVVRGLARDLGLTHGKERGRFSASTLDSLGAALLDVDLKTVNSF